MDMNTSFDDPGPSASSSYPPREESVGGLASFASLAHSRAGSAASSYYPTSPSGHATLSLANLNASSPSRPLTTGSVSTHSSDMNPSPMYTLPPHHPHPQDVSLHRFALSNPQISPSVVTHHQDHGPIFTSCSGHIINQSTPVSYDGYRPLRQAILSGPPSRPTRAYSPYPYTIPNSPRLARSVSEGRAHISHESPNPTPFITSQLAQLQASRSLSPPPTHVHRSPAMLSHARSSQYRSPALSGSPTGPTSSSSGATTSALVDHRLDNSLVERVDRSWSPHVVLSDRVTRILCLHACVAQKSYGQERRFLCPPPMVQLSGPYRSLPIVQRPILSVTILDEEGTCQVAQACCPDDNPSTASTFKNLYISGRARKGRSITLQLGIHPPSENRQIGFASCNNSADVEQILAPFATFQSRPCAILSKPSKRTAKARSIQSCILNGSLICLFNRINSQTVRTKYLCIENDQFAARASIWSAFYIRVTRKAAHRESSLLTSTIPGADRTITYGSEVILVDYVTHISSEPLIVRKVEKDRAQVDATGPVSQMQKLALCKFAKHGSGIGSPLYLSALSSVNVDALTGVRVLDMSSGACAEHEGKIQYQAIRGTAPAEEVDKAPWDIIDSLSSWTVMGVDQFEHSFLDNSPQGCRFPSTSLTPFPSISDMPTIDISNATISLKVQWFFDRDPATGTDIPLEVWLGPIGPLPFTLIEASGGPHGQRQHQYQHQQQLKSSEPEHVSQLRRSTSCSSSLLPSPSHCHCRHHNQLYHQQQKQPFHSSSPPMSDIMKREATIQCLLPPLINITKAMFQKQPSDSEVSSFSMDGGDDDENANECVDGMTKCDYMAASTQHGVQEILVKSGMIDIYNCRQSTTSTLNATISLSTSECLMMGGSSGLRHDDALTSSYRQQRQQQQQQQQQHVLPIIFMRPDGISFSSSKGICIDRVYLSGSESGSYYLPRIV